MGTVLGAFLSKAGLEPDLIDLDRSHVEMLRKHGARIVGSVEMLEPVHALMPDELHKSYDLVFLMTKQLDNESAIRTLLPHLSETGVICTAQNGMPELMLAELVGEEKTFGSAVAWGATKLGDGVCELTSSPDSLTFSIGTPGHNVKKLEEIRSVLEKMGPTIIETNFVGARWSKLLINSAFSAMSAVLGCSFGEAARHKRSRRCIQRLIKECIDVADKAGISIEPVQGRDIRKLLDYNNRLKEYLVYLLIPIVIKKHASLRASMLQDLEKGRLCEVDAINGVVSKLGQVHRVPTPYNDRAIELIHAIERGEYKPEMANLLLFEDLC